MEDKTLMETTEVVTKTNGGKVAGLVLGAVGVLGGIAAAIIYKNRKNKVVESEETIVENNENTIEE